MRQINPVFRFAMERTTTFINIWFWARNDGSVPSDVQSGGPYVDTDNWVNPLPDQDRRLILSRNREYRRLHSPIPLAISLNISKKTTSLST